MVTTIALLIVTAPVLCPVLYYWVVPSANRRPRIKTSGERSDTAGTRKLLQTSLVFVGAVAACGLVAGKPLLALAGIAGVVVLAVMLIWAD